jgi:hypothetical protein
MKKITLLQQVMVQSVIILFCFPVFSQQFTCITDYGWAGGISYSRPCLVDIDIDGLFDMLAGSDDGKLLHFEQVAQGDFHFDLVSTAFNNIIFNDPSAVTLGDIDGDGLLDMLASGNSDLEYYEQNSPGSYDFTMVSSSFNNISGYNLIPLITNLDNDALVDLLVGTIGGLNYYEQAEAGSMDFNLVASPFSDIYLGLEGSFCAGYIDDNNLMDIICGNDDDLYQYEQISPNSLIYEFKTSEFKHLEIGWAISPFPIDLNLDGLTDLVFGEETGSLQYLENQADDFINFTMADTSLSGIDVGWQAKPELMDIDNDGLLDMIVGHDDVHLYQYEQTDPQSIDFVLQNANFLGTINNYSLYPAFADIDNDDLLDLLVGTGAGTIQHYEQNAVNSYSFSLVTDYFNEINVSSQVTPVLYDLDGDNLLDLIVQITSNTVYHYEQQVANSLIFDETFDEITGLYAETTSGTSGIEITDLDGDNKADIILSNYQHLSYFEAIAPNSLNFEPVNEYYLETDDYGNVPDIGDFDQDGSLDMILGNNDGLIRVYKEDTAAHYNYHLVSDKITNSIDVGLNSCPVVYDLNNDGVLDMLIGSKGGKITLYTQDITDTLKFVINNFNFSDINTVPYDQLSPALVDLDDDGRLDLLIGDYSGHLLYYEQTDTNAFYFAFVTNNFCSINVASNAAPCFADIDQDGLTDLLIGDQQGKLSRYEQESLQSLNFIPVSANFNDIDVGSYSQPAIGDLNGNGLLDLLIGNLLGEVYYYEQNAPGSEVFNLISDNFIDAGPDSYTAPALADIDMDGLTDVVIGSKTGGLNLYLQNLETGIQKNPGEFGWNLRTGPNPAAEILYIHSDIGLDKVCLYEITGQCISKRTVQSNDLEIPVGDFPAGIYFLNIKSEKNSITTKIIVRH